MTHVRLLTLTPLREPLLEVLGKIPDSAHTGEAQMPRGLGTGSKKEGSRN